MKQRRYATPQPVINVHLHTAGKRECPACGEPYDREMPLLGGNGVGTAWIHREPDEDDTFRICYDFAVLTDDDVDVDRYCVFQTGGDDAEPASEGGGATSGRL